MINFEWQTKQCSLGKSEGGRERKVKKMGAGLGRMGEEWAERAGIFTKVFNKIDSGRGDGPGLRTPQVHFGNLG